MTHCYTQLNLQIVFAVKYRATLIEDNFKHELYGYMAANINNRSHRCLIINGMPDHIHILLQMHPSESLSSLMQIIKGSSSRWINAKYCRQQNFKWQEGYSAFSYSQSQIPVVIRYIQNQEKHHQKQTFLEEHKTILNKFNIPYDPQG
ncbi:IS200/IS605 family transposase [Chitinophaga flava]|uniref:IS200/IS605 family transposase n=1 Tax=Chitinophaga flava TaxID=2259036 RepID=A0A365XTD3_9BACT|nr:IS200/IS605 family transposase [Chitinophaga flava]RBL89400.1 IS200/IS605 family transposase [Chitinophaga flava]